MKLRRGRRRGVKALAAAAAGLALGAAGLLLRRFGKRGVGSSRPAGPSKKARKK